MLKQNSKATLDEYIAQKDKNGTEAYAVIHPNASRVTATNNFHSLLKKPDAQIYLKKHIDKAKTTIVSLTDSEKDDIRLRASQDILDRSTGKARQAVDIQSTSVSLTIDLTSSLGGDS